jgi:HPr kinase/phosphorylase
MSQIHATCVEMAGTGVLLRGAPGSGKSDLALRLIDGGARLVADDRVDLRVADGGLRASAPPALAGRIEVRGIGILCLPAVAEARVGLVCDLVAPETVERLPPAETADLMGIAVPRLAMAPFEASAAAKLRVAIRSLARGMMAVDHVERHR